MYSLGAFDRFNYGDLLFPLVLEQIAGERFDHRALTSKAMIDSGAKSVQAFQYSEGESNVSVLIAGGDALSAGWFGAFWQLYPTQLDLAFKVAYRLLPHDFLDQLVRQKFKTGWVSPYVPSLEWLESGNRFAYNAVGCSDLDGLSPKHRTKVSEVLKDASYLSVRDQESQRQLKKLGITSELAPDSVASLGSTWGRNEYDHSGALFQCSSAWLSRNAELALQILPALKAKFGCVSFLPIGLAGGHSDLVAARRLQRAFPDLEILNVRDIRGIFDEIAKSEFIFSSSLHGHISAVATRTPTMIAPEVSKLREYVSTWSSSITVPAVAGGISEQIQRALRVSASERQEVAETVAALASNNTATAVEAIE